MSLHYVGLDEALITPAGAGTQLTRKRIGLRTQMPDMLSIITDDGRG